MSSAIDAILEKVCREPGLLAAGVVSGGRALAACTPGPGLEDADLSALWRHLSDAADVSQHHRMPPLQMRWVFEHVLVYCVRRSDGVLLALVFSRGREAAPGQKELEPLFDAFRNLNEPGTTG